jgi:manganese/zinc/iron transport system permease protein
VSDALAHATLPGVGLAFILLVALGGDGRNADRAAAGLGGFGRAWALGGRMDLARHRLTEDAAIGAVLAPSSALASCC